MKNRCGLLAGAVLLAGLPTVAAQENGKIPGGRLDAIGAESRALGSCPLRHTAVEAEISGMVARVKVTQQFHNPFEEKIEAVYVFPLHQDSAIEAMTMTIGERVVKGVIKERDEARRLYEEAKQEGQHASLLDQERANVFTQAVANIGPGEEVAITIEYSQTMAWEEGRFEFDFPAVVGPRYIPGSASPRPAAEPGEDDLPSFFREPRPERAPHEGPPVANPAPAAPTDEVPDADRITPPVVEEGYRAGHDLSIRVVINAGRPIEDIESALHEIVVAHPDGHETRAVVTLKDKAAIPNRDFVISYRTAGEEIADEVLAHTGSHGNFFTLVVQPPARVRQEEVVPRELVFVLDTSGSMSGFPIETSKALVRRAIESLRPDDAFNLVTFAGSTAVLAPQPLANTAPNRQRALRFIDTLHGSGGTEMMKAINLALGGGPDPKKVRLVCFLTDGFVGNDLAIVGAVQKHAGTTRVFSFGIGTSVNRFLLDAMAHAGRGEAHYVLSHHEAKKAADAFYERIDAPVLTGIELDFGGLKVEEVFPKRVEDLFAAKPVVVKGRYREAGEGVVVLTGTNAAGRFERRIPVSLPAANAGNGVLASQWARAKAEDLMMQDMEGLQRGEMQTRLKKEIVDLGLAYSLLTPFTSFVAVEERQVTEGGVPRTIHVPVEMPEGVSYRGVFGGTAGAASTVTKGGFGAGWGSGGDGGGGGFGNIPAAMMKRCSKEDRLARLRANGGNGQCEEAVVKTLDWLTSRQNKDGSWCERDKTLATGYALLAFLGHCETPLSEKYGECVTNAMLYLIDVSEKNNGKLADNPADPRWQFGHAVAAYALAEAYNFCSVLSINIPGLEDAVRKAGQAIIGAQAKDGGWAYAAGAPGDLALACTNLQALMASRRTRVDNDRLVACAKSALPFIERRQQPNGAIGDTLEGAPVGSFPLTGAGAVAFQTWDRVARRVPELACRFLSNKDAFKWAAEGADLHALYHDSRAMINAGGEAWTKFNGAFLPEVLGAQNGDGSFKDLGAADGAIEIWGPPTRGDGDLAMHCRSCLAALTLEVYYRFLPSDRR